ncbi:MULTISPECIES: CBS domain-containing protein [unclassified Ruegeria]|uniref:CBS domain-containing protein n=1 Tax=unclassified Ruegeria TaxID=2625375 RepID=UPI001487B112|nr:MULTISPECIES: CBS domain-containing protein [unclassified Ruegeria]NOD34408.1 CBS domain-containing protein [Ruegeria sp. HKCCD7296]NOD47528.1 CBS domain-containing protein [Ruegeria sp. HKCCD5849]NOD53079.1 CBS domain-containing protein [Ruegeria sp. HKCCD5851]NOD66272.1 CBS domain-containing protein [Ruegeria sp. HKCCD7303]NOE34239.1 CBS domain-containing protein [Ruegeria sp. HKCCD7318]
MAPTSYQAPMRGDKEEKTTYSQTTGSNLAQSKTAVSKLLEGKGGDVFSVRPNETIHSVVNILKEKRIGAVLVTDQNGALQGILSERDIVRRMADTPGQTLPQSVEDLMTKEVKTCTTDDLLNDVLKTMTEGRFRHMPVLRDGKLCGVITIGDVVHFRLKELEYEALRMKQMIVG